VHRLPSVADDLSAVAAAFERANGGDLVTGLSSATKHERSRRPTRERKPWTTRGDAGAAIAVHWSA